MTTIEWAAGLFEGEGSITLRHAKGTERLYQQLQLASTDEDVMLAFASVVGGRVNGPYQHKGGTERGWKPFWSWAVTNQQAVEVFDRLSPFLGARRLARWAEVNHDASTSQSVPDLRYRRDAGSVGASGL